MKNLVLILVFLFTCFNLKAQCKFEENKTDAFTGERIVITKDKDIAAHLFAEAIICKIKHVKSAKSETLTIMLKLVNQGKIKMGFKPGELLYIKLANDTVLSIPGNLSKEKMSTGVLLDAIENEYTINRHQLELLKKFELKGLRLVYFNTKTQAEDNFDYEKKATITKDAFIIMAKCID